jgi:hypothetical protein
VDFRQNYVLRIIDCPFDVVEAYYTKSNSLYIESAFVTYAFDERGILLELPDDTNDDEVWEDMVNVDSFEELKFFEDNDDTQRRLIGINLHVGNRKLSCAQFETVVEIDGCIGSKAIEGIAKTNTADNLHDYKESPISIPLVIVADRDLLLYPENIHLPTLLPGVGKVGLGSAIYSGSRVIAVYRN